jgi:hypothetical protein
MLCTSRMSKRGPGATGVVSKKAAKGGVGREVCDDPMDGSKEESSDVIPQYRLVCSAIAAYLQGAVVLSLRSGRQGHLHRDLVNVLSMEEMVSCLRQLERVVIEMETSEAVILPSEAGKILHLLRYDNDMVLQQDSTPTSIVSARNILLANANTLKSSVHANLQFCTDATTLLDILNGATRSVCDVFLRGSDSHESVLKACVDSISRLYAFLRHCQIAAFALSEYSDITKHH